jgi:ElaB/YqjD/DUF883 family membrane-anchored ribosome-binding protein
VNNNLTGYIADQLQNRTAESGRRIRTTARTLRSVAQDLRSDANTVGAAHLAELGADMIDRFGSYVETTDIQTMVSDAERFSREQPWIVATAGIAAGLLASRLIKSTAARRA